MGGGSTNNPEVIWRSRKLGGYSEDVRNEVAPILRLEA